MSKFVLAGEVVCVPRRTTIDRDALLARQANAVREKLGLTCWQISVSAGVNYDSVLRFFRAGRYRDFRRGSRGSLRVDNMLKILNAIGLDIELSTSEGSGTLVASKPLRKMSMPVVYVA